jgi:glycosyltransferase involved in cell wall biosynthesis
MSAVRAVEAIHEDRWVDISVVVPVKNERGTLAELVERVAERCRTGGRSFELIFVDDGSDDGSWPAILELCAEHPEVRAFRQRRNFGKAAALNLGFTHARGQVVITMDGDLQDDPAEIPRFLETIAGGYDAVSGWKKDRKDPLSKRLPSRVFNAVLRSVSGLELHDFNCGFKAYSREAVTSLLPYVYGDMHRYLPALLAAQGFRVGEIEVRHHARRYGSSKYGAGRMLAGALDMLTVVLLTRFRYRPLHAFGRAAMALVLVALAIALGLGVDGAPRHAVEVLAVAAVAVVLLLCAGLICELFVHALGTGRPEPGPAEAVPRAGRSWESLDHESIPFENGLRVDRARS